MPSHRLIIRVLLSLGLCFSLAGSVHAEAGSKNKQGWDGSASKGHGKGAKGDDTTSVTSSRPSSPEDDEPIAPAPNESSSVPSGPVPEGVCVSPDAPKRVAECPSNAPKNMKGGGGLSSKLKE